MKWTLALFIPTALGAALFVTQDWPSTVGLTRAESPSARSPSLSLNDAQSPGEREAQRLIFAAGFVEGTQREAELNFEIEGRLAAILVAEGDTVQGGDVLARLAPAVWQEQVAQAEAKLELAQAKRERLLNAAREETRRVADAEVQVAAVKTDLAERDLLRGERLLSQQAISQQQWDEIQHAYRQAVAELELARAQAKEIKAGARPDEIRMAEARIELAKAELRHARTMLQKTQLTAPTDGIVLSVDAEPGELLGPDRAVPVITMTNADQLRVRAYVEELDALAVRPGQRAYVTADGKPGKKFPGTVVSCAPHMAPKQHRHHKPGERLDIKVRETLIRLDNPEALVIGLPVDVFIQPRTLEQTKTGAEFAGRRME